MKKLGLGLNAKKSVASSAQRTIFLRVVWDSIMMQAQLSPALVELTLNAMKDIKLGQELSVLQVQRLLDLVAAGDNVIPLGLLHMFQFWLKSRRFHPLNHPSTVERVTRRVLCALRLWKEQWFMNKDQALGAPCHCKTLMTDTSLTG